MLSGYRGLVIVQLSRAGKVQLEIYDMLGGVCGRWFIKRRLRAIINPHGMGGIMVKNQ
jgi:hypothetical protein